MPIETIYLAGKIEKNDWRHKIVRGLESGSPLKASNQIITDGLFTQWPVLKCAIFSSFHYTGPYFISGETVSFHGEGTHGVRADMGIEGDPFEGIDFTTVDEGEDILNAPYGGHGPGECYGLSYATIVSRCEQAIRHSDLVFAWIDDPTCYGTIAEIGYAKALGKMIWIAGPRKYRDLSFVYEMAHKTKFEKVFPITVLKAWLDLYRREHPVFSSPIEQTFWDAWTGHIPVYYRLEPQYAIGKFYVDFAHLPTKTVIELDGFASHSSTTDIANDRKRQRWIEELGWHFVRFGGREVHNDVNACVKQVFQRIVAREQERKGIKKAS